MDIQVIQAPFHKEIYGCSGVAVNDDFAGTGVRLMNQMWAEVKKQGLKNKGVNIWLYEKNGMTAGVELEEKPLTGAMLQYKVIHLSKYVYYKQTGPYSQLRQTFIDLVSETKKMGISVIYPFLEVYGHWEENENKLVTEIIMNIKEN